MKVTLTDKIDRRKGLVLFAFEKEKAPCGLPQQRKLLQDAEGEGFKAKEGTTALLHPKNGLPSRQVIMTGLGEKKGFNFEKLRRAAAAAAKKAQSLSQSSITVVLPQLTSEPEKEARAAAEGIILATYKYRKYITHKNDVSPIREAAVCVSRSSQNEAKKGLRLAQILSDSDCFVRNLVNDPPSELTPSKFVELSREIGENGQSCGVSITVLDKEKLEEMGMGAILGVNRGSPEPPALIHFHYKPANARRSVALVGKGITFDSGGLSLKPSESMETMKMDMAGAASILGVFKAIPSLKPSVEVHGVLALTENMPGGRAQKPGDILRTMSGKSIEVLNTDAEGRLVLADALSYAVKLKTDAIIDLATLTGACIVALGSLVAGAMGNSDELFKEIVKASNESGERFWQLPLVEDYKEGLKSPIADIKNISSVRKEGGSIIGGLFLQEFVDGKPWLHLDIAGPAWTDRELPYCSQGGTGFPTRTLIHYLLNLSHK